jgi:hypothetical protein
MTSMAQQFAHHGGMPGHGGMAMPGHPMAQVHPGAQGMAGGQSGMMAPQMHGVGGPQGQMMAMGQATPGMAGPHGNGMSQLNPNNAMQQHLQQQQMAQASKSTTNPALLRHSTDSFQCKQTHNSLPSNNNKEPLKLRDYRYNKHRCYKPSNRGGW